MVAWIRTTLALYRHAKKKQEMTLNALDHGVLMTAPKWLNLMASGRLNLFLPWRRFGESGIQCSSKIPRVILSGDLWVLYGDINYKHITFSKYYNASCWGYLVVSVVSRLVVLWQQAYC
jgi:hypothetical protein